MPSLLFRRSVGWGLLTGWVIITAIYGCATVPVTRELKQVDEISSLHPQQHYIKAHMKDGKVFILYQWQLQSDTTRLMGYGSWLDENRRIIETRHPSQTSTSAVSFSIPLQDVALIETNQTGESISAGLAIVTGITAVLTLYCATNPKACFGSCPTFYAFNGDQMALMAEGFSSSIAPSLEQGDIDMLYHAVPSSSFQLQLTNEALESHVIRYARLLVFPKEGEQRVFATPEQEYYRCDNIQSPVACRLADLDCTGYVTHADGKEFFTDSDPKNLNSKEEIFVTFHPDVEGQKGLIIGKRQTLMTTFLIYQGLAYMGAGATYWLAELERGVKRPENDVFNLLGGIEVFRKTASGGWQYEGRVLETGPIATDYSIIPLDAASGDPIELKLRLNKGLWRIDYLALGQMLEKTEPIVVQPSAVNRVTGTEKDPFAKLLDDPACLVTQPGDAYTIVYDLPFTSAELFLDTRGYYLEWIREEWIREQNFRKLKQFLYQPEKFLKSIAGTYKSLEPGMEETFWNSRYGQH